MRQSVALQHEERPNRRTVGPLLFWGSEGETTKALGTPVSVNHSDTFSWAPRGKSPGALAPATHPARAIYPGT